MKAIYTLIITGVFSMLALSCDLIKVQPLEPGEGPDTPSADKGLPVSVTASVGELSKAGHASGELSEGSLGLFFESEGTGGNADYNAYNREVRYGGSGWEITGGGLFWKDKDTEASYFAYYPYSPDIADDGTWSLKVPTTQDASSIKAADFLYAMPRNASYRSGNGEIEIDFGHVMAKLKVELVLESGIGSGAVVRSVTLGNCATVGEFDLSNDTWWSANRIADITMYDNGTCFECILIPQVVEYELYIEIDDNGTERTFTYTAELEQEFDRGTEYTLPVRVGGSNVVMGRITSGAWEEEDGGSLITK